MKQAKIIEKCIKQRLQDFLESLGSTRYFVEAEPRGKGFIAKIWIEKDIFDEIAADREKLHRISDAVSDVEWELGIKIFEEMKPLL